MAQIRRILLTIIGVISGAWVALDMARRSAGAGASRFVTNPPSVTPKAPPLPKPRGIAGWLAPKARTIALPAPGPTEPTTHPTDSTKPIARKDDLADVHSAWGYLKTLYFRYNDDHCGAWAASMSFFALLSVPAVLLCSLAVLGFLIKSPDEAALRVQEIIANLLPGKGTQEQAAKLIKDMHIRDSAETLRHTRTLSGVVGVASLFWSALSILMNSITPMNAAFRVEESRSWPRQVLVAFGVLLGVAVVFLLSLVPPAGAQIVNAHQWFGDNATVAGLVTLVAFLLGVVINALMFVLIYRNLPSPKANLTWKQAAYAGGFVAVLWELAKQGFALYLARFNNYDKVYGTLGGLVVLVLWIYYSSIILLLGAEIAKLHMDWQAKRRAKITGS